MSLFNLKEWTGNYRRDLLSGILVALAMIPQAISFAIIAGVDPKVGLYTAFIIAIITAIFGGRPGMVSSAAAATALLMSPLVSSVTKSGGNGLQYLLAASILAGILQLFGGAIKLAKQLRFVSRAVMLGFVNALAILIFKAQLPEITGENATFLIYGMVAVSLAIIYLLPRFSTLIPSPLVAIIIITVFSVLTNSGVPTVGDRGELPTTLPNFAIPQIPFTFETLQTIFPYAIFIALVGLLESFLTAIEVDELTNTGSDKNKEAIGQGIANVITGLFGGMAGCAIIGPSIVNLKFGGRTRLSSLSAGVFLLIFMLFLSTQVEKIPMAALVAVMIMVSISTFNWTSLKQLGKVPPSETAVMLTTIAMTIVSNNLGIGVLSGVALNALLFSRKIAQLVFVDREVELGGKKRIYQVRGQIFFASANEFIEAFELKDKAGVEFVKIDLTHAHLWDQSAIAALDKVILNFRRQGIEAEVVGLNEASATLVDKLAIHPQLDIAENLVSHK